MDWARQHQQQIQYWSGVAFFVATIAGLLWLAASVYASVSDSRLSPMNRLLIGGERNFVQDQELQQALASIPQSGNFFSLNVDLVQQALEQLPWVQQVSVRKQWPDKLRIHLQEQRVAARWNQQQLLNQQGEIFEAEQDRIKQALVELSGPDNQAARVLAVFEELKPRLAQQKIAIASLSLSERHAWQLELDNQVTIKLGQEDRDNRVARFLAVYPQLELDKVAYLDLRYDTGLAVGWKKQGLDLNDQSNG